MIDKQFLIFSEFVFRNKGKCDCGFEFVDDPMETYDEDINPAEICSQIQSDNLKQWCETIQTAMKMAMVQLPCWGGNE